MNYNLLIINYLCQNLIAGYSRLANQVLVARNLYLNRFIFTLIKKKQLILYS